jgi:plasmid stabilization system protein ParE
MSTKLRFHARFRADLRRQLAHLAEHGDQRWIEGLRTGIDEALDLLSHHPSAGTVEARRDDGVLRRLVLRRVPYVVWYVVERREVWLLRLFHGRQSRAAPSWPKHDARVARRRKPPRP